MGIHDYFVGKSLACKRNIVRGKKCALFLLIFKNFKAFVSKSSSFLCQALPFLFYLPSLYNMNVWSNCSHVSARIALHNCFSKNSLWLRPSVVPPLSPQPWIPSPPSVWWRVFVELSKSTRDLLKIQPSTVKSDSRHILYVYTGIYRSIHYRWLVVTSFSGANMEDMQDSMITYDHIFSCQEKGGHSKRNTIDRYSVPRCIPVI